MKELIERITLEIEKEGSIPFSRFMELALYCPVYGYYEKEADSIGASGDFYTSVSVGSLFGELMAARFAWWLEEADDMAQGLRLQIVECGAHRGFLARDILHWLAANRSDLLARIDYWLLEPSPSRREAQQVVLEAYSPSVRWADGLAELAVALAGTGRPGPEGGGMYSKEPGVCGVIFSNELLDAFPVRRLGWGAANQEWFEWGVSLVHGRFDWVRRALAHPQMWDTPAWRRLGLPSELLSVLPDGFTVEVGERAADWWREAAGMLRWGRLITIDYGFTEEEFLAPGRKAGTLRSYRHHQVGGDLLACPGEQDLTAHIDFSALETVGESVGLRTDGLVTQARFLTEIAEEVWAGRADSAGWTPERRRQFQTLTHPELLGRPFRVLVQDRL